jgi:uncharacterized membrane protein
MKIPKLPVAVWVACVVVFVASVALLAPGLPDRVASHFGSGGAANGWTARSSYTAFSIIFGIGLSSFVIGICYIVRFFPAAALNVPNPTYWRSPDHYPAACNFLFGHAFWFGALAAIWGTLFNGLVVRANHFSPPVLDTKALAILTVALLGGTFVWALSMVRHFRNPPRDPA